MPPIENNNTSSKKGIWSLIVVVVLCALVYYLYSSGYLMNKKEVNNLLDTDTETSLGGEIYNNSVNPLDGALPETTNTVVNPLEESYKNPFE